ncbi:hypothetical protein LPN01_04570 [Sphingomonas sp. A2-49]|uniref:hypothetical protein n=1 Tax=Sphingomonas sp. A2-49 TaxID=1391375 RepID=UPI0021D271C6|nr:hypothetical protein [Sphingomonas sp. A2-49]MCU6453346.1 hypothetical protein [Sphingomonas sp. A2-49]
MARNNRTSIAPVRELLLERRLDCFRRLIIIPAGSAAVLALTRLVPSVAADCFSWVLDTAIAAALELIGSYYIAGLSVAYATWFLHGPFERRIMLRLSLVGFAGSAGSISVAVVLLQQRCAL